MNDLIHTGGVQTMSSREIADLTSKEHRNVLRDVRDMLIQLHGEGGLLNFEHSYLNAQNRPQPEFRLPKRETLILVSGYNLEMRAKIIDRWQELETRERPDPMVALNDPATMRGLLLSYSEKVLELETANAELTPKAEALDRIATADGSLNITASAKALQVRPKDLFAYLQAHGWIYRRNGGSGYLGYQSKVTTGLLEHKVTTVLRGDGSEKIVEQVLVTAKGLTKLAALLRPSAHLQGIDRMTEKIREILDAVTAKVFGYQPANKAKWAKSAKERKSAKDEDDNHSSI